MQRLCVNLPEALLWEIMLWLPPESLRRFKGVCKSWYVLITSLIKNPEFVAKHLANSKNKKSCSPSIVYFRNVLTTTNPESQRGTYFLTLACEDDFYDDLDDGFNDCCSIPCVTQNLTFLTFDLLYYPAELVGHCNGIICLSVQGSFVLLNPAMRELKVVSHASPGDNGSSTVGVGFGYDSRGDEYKAVNIKSLGEFGDGPYEAELFTLSTNSWKEIELDVDIIFFPCSDDHQVVYCNGVCYWCFWFFGCTILSFDVSDEVFEIIPSPKNVREIERECDTMDEWTKIAVWKDRLVMFYYPELDPMVIDMWIMDASSGGGGGGPSYSWSKHLTIGPLENIKCPLVFWDADELIMETKDGAVIFYNLCNQKLDDHTISLQTDHQNRIVSYAKSLVSVLKREER